MRPLNAAGGAAWLVCVSAAGAVLCVSTAVPAKATAAASNEAETSHRGCIGTPPTISHTEARDQVRRCQSPASRPATRWVGIGQGRTSGRTLRRVIRHRSSSTATARGSGHEGCGRGTGFSRPEHGDARRAGVRVEDTPRLRDRHGGRQGDALRGSWRTDRAGRQRQSRWERHRSHHGGVVGCRRDEDRLSGIASRVPAQAGASLRKRRRRTARAGRNTIRRRSTTRDSRKD